VFVSTLLYCLVVALCADAPAESCATCGWMYFRYVLEDHLPRCWMRSQLYPSRHNLVAPPDHRLWVPMRVWSNPDAPRLSRMALCCTIWMMSLFVTW
jgi:hypothetical protein